jgi:hypothetical protein
MRTRTSPKKQSQKLNAKSPQQQRKRPKEKVIRLTIHRNLLPWYDELDDSLDLEAANFPKSVLDQINAFGDYEIEEISSKWLRLMKIKPKAVAENKSEAAES